MFANDLVLFGEASEIQADTIIKCIFANASGQNMNKLKTRVYFSRDVHISRGMTLSQYMGVHLTGDLRKYLGIPLIHHKPSYVTFSALYKRPIED